MSDGLARRIARRLRADLRRVNATLSGESVPAVRFDHVPSVAPQIQRHLRRSRRWSPDRQLRAAHPYLVDAEHASDADFADLAARLGQALAALTDDRLHMVPLEDRVRCWLAAQGRRQELADFIVEREFHAGNVLTRLDGGDLRADFAELHPPGIPPRLVTLTPQESELEIRIRRCRRVADGVEIEVFALARPLDHDTHPGEYVVEAAGAPLPPGSVARVSDPAATRFAGRWFQSHDNTALLVRLPTQDDADLPDLRFTFTYGDFRRTATLGADRIRARLPVPPPAGVPVVCGARVVAGDLVLDGLPHPLPLRTRGSDGRLRPRRSGPIALPEGTAPAMEFAGRLPMELLTDVHRIEIDSTDGRLRVGLFPPLTDAERGPRRHQLARERHWAQTVPLEPSLVLFNSFAGETATDSPAAIYRELRRRRPDLRLVWTVADHGVVVPEGAETVVVRSSAWFDAWSSARMIVTNIEPDRFFRRRPGQEVVQTCHGYPSKAMGMVQWRAKNFSPRRIQRARERSAGNWSILLTPDPSADVFYRREYDWDGPIISEGYPRDDDLAGAGVAERRRAARERLGLAEQQRAILYAPTWRDHLAEDYRRAGMVDHLDIDRLVRRLGPDCVVLLRGHRFNRAEGDRQGVLDVTDHPEINDLILASDAAVLDYSSLRFDYAITGKPMVFLVPDLETYTHDGRGFLFPFVESAPGPLVRDTDGVAGELADLDGLRRRYAARLAAFNARFQPRNDGGAAARVVDRLLELL